MPLSAQSAHGNLTSLTELGEWIDSNNINNLHVYNTTFDFIGWRIGGEIVKHLCYAK